MKGTALMYPQDTINRFWNKVNKTESCWLWTGYCMPFGHGQIRVNKKTILTHRFSWEIHFGPIPDGLQVCHHCDRGACIRIEHLFLGTQADNMADARRKGRTYTGGSGDAAPHGEKHWNSKLTREQVQEIIDMRNSNTTYAVIAEQFDISTSHVREICVGNSWIHANKPPLEVTNLRRKLTESDVVAILKRLKAGESQSALGREYGVHSGTINSIVRNMSWRWIPRP